MQKAYVLYNVKCKFFLPLCLLRISKHMSKTMFFMRKSNKQKLEKEMQSERKERAEIRNGNK